MRPGRAQVYICAIVIFLFCSIPHDGQVRHVAVRVLFEEDALAQRVEADPEQDHAARDPQGLQLDAEDLPAVL